MKIIDLTHTESPVSAADYVWIFTISCPAFVSFTG